MQHFRAVFSKAINFIKIDIWRISSQSLSREKSFLINILRTVLLAIRGFDEDKCMLRASALTFYSLLSIVPVLALAFGIAKGFGFEKHLEVQLFERLPGQEEMLTRIVSFAQALLENTKGGMVAGIGVIVLFWAVMKVLGHIESSFNDIWEIKKSRTAVRKFSDYLSIMLISPIFLVMSGSVTIFVTTQITNITARISLLGMFSPLIMIALKLFPYCLIGLLLTIIYMIMPNTKVNFKAALVAGIIAGTTYVILQWAYINFQVGIAKHNAIYGSFAAVPLFLVWLQISWVIVLFGAEISFAIQNVDTYEFEVDCLGITPAFKKLLSLQICHLVVKAFSEGEKPLTAPQISGILETPVRLVRLILYELVESGLFSDTKNDETQESAYQPARDINMFSIKYVIEALDQRGVDNVPVAQTKELKVLSNTLQDFGYAIEKCPANKLLRDI